MMNSLWDRKLSRTRALGSYLFLLLIVLHAAGCTSQSAIIKDENSYIWKAENYYHQKEYVKAKKELKSILIKNPKDIEALFLLGVISGKQGSTSASRKTFKKIISLDPQYSKAYYNIGVLYANSKSAGDRQNSIKYFDKFLELEPDTELRQELEQWKAYHLNH